MDELDLAPNVLGSASARVVPGDSRINFLLRCFHGFRILCCWLIVSDPFADRLAVFAFRLLSFEMASVGCILAGAFPCGADLPDLVRRFGVKPRKRDVPGLAAKHRHRVGMEFTYGVWNLKAKCISHFRLNILASSLNVVRSGILILRL